MVRFHAIAKGIAARAAAACIFIAPPGVFASSPMTDAEAAKLSVQQQVQATPAGGEEQDRKRHRITAPVALRGIESATATAAKKSRQSAQAKAVFQLKMFPRMTKSVMQWHRQSHCPAPVMVHVLGDPVALELEEGLDSCAIRAAYGRAVKLEFGIPDLAPEDNAALFEDYATLNYRLFFEVDASCVAGELDPEIAAFDPNVVCRGSGETMPWGQADNVGALQIAARDFAPHQHGADGLRFVPSGTPGDDREPATPLGAPAAGLLRQQLHYLALATRQSTGAMEGASCQGALWGSMLCTRARKALAHAVSLAPASAEARSREVEFYLNAGQADSSLEDNEVVLEKCRQWGFTDPKSPLPHIFRAEVLLRRGRQFGSEPVVGRCSNIGRGGAKAACRRAMRLAPGCAEARAMLAVLLLEEREDGSLMPVVEAASEEEDGSGASSSSEDQAAAAELRDTEVRNLLRDAENLEHQRSAAERVRWARGLRGTRFARGLAFDKLASAAKKLVGPSGTAFFYTEVFLRRWVEAEPTNAKSYYVLLNFLETTKASPDEAAAVRKALEELVAQDNLALSGDMM